MAQLHFDPETYESLIAEEVPAYVRLHDEARADSRRLRDVIMPVTVIPRLTVRGRGSALFVHRLQP